MAYPGHIQNVTIWYLVFWSHTRGECFLSADQNRSLRFSINVRQNVIFKNWSKPECTKQSQHRALFPNSCPLAFHPLLTGCFGANRGREASFISRRQVVFCSSGVLDLLFHEGKLLSTVSSGPRKGNAEASRRSIVFDFLLYFQDLSPPDVMFGPEVERKLTRCRGRTTKLESKT